MVHRASLSSLVPVVAVRLLLVGEQASTSLLKQVSSRVGEGKSKNFPLEEGVAGVFKTVFATSFSKSCLLDLRGGGEIRLGGLARFFRE